jgi:SOS-response transcriptional repressor LexA
VRHGGQADPETGGQYTVKLYRQQKGAKGTAQIVLQPANPEFAPIVVAPGEIDAVRVLAEVVEVLPG